MGFQTALWSQSDAALDLRLEREARYQAWKVLNRYQQYHNLDDLKAQNRFKLLFADEANLALDIPFYNHNGDNRTTLDLDGYVANYAEFFALSPTKSVTVTPVNIQANGLDDKLTLEVSFTKQFNGQACIEELPDKPFMACPEIQYLVMTIAVSNGSELKEYWRNPKDKSGFVQRKPKLEFAITGVRWSDLQVPYYLQLVDRSGVDSLEFLCGEAITDVSDHLVLLKGESPYWVVRDQEGKRPDSEIEAKQHNAGTPPKEIVQPYSILKDTKRAPFSLHAGVALMGGSQASVEDASNNSAQWTSKTGQSAQLGIGYAFVQSNACIWDVHVSAGFSKTAYQFESATLNYATAATDPDGFDYVRLTRAEQWQETLTEQVFHSEVALMVLWNTSKSRQDRKSNWWLGARYGYSYGLWSQTSFTAQATLDHRGYYPELYGITIDESGVYDFGAHSGTGQGESEWKGASQHQGSIVVGLQFKKQPAWMLLGHLGGAYLSRSNDDGTSAYVVGTDQLNAGIHQANTLGLSTWTAGLGVRKRLGFKYLGKTPCE